MKDGILRTAVKRLALVVYTIDLSGTRLLRRVRGERPWRLGGRCQLCAKCCEAPTIQTSRWVFRFRLLRALFLAWHRRVNGFELVSEESHRRLFVFRCTHFDWQTRQCDSYHSRPGMCRDYPRLLLWEANPPFLPGCGYRAVSPRADKVSELLERENLPPEKLEDVREKLRLRK